MSLGRGRRRQAGQLLSFGVASWAVICMLCGKVVLRDVNHLDGIVMALGALGTVSQFDNVEHLNREAWSCMKSAQFEGHKM